MIGKMSTDNDGHPYYYLGAALTLLAFLYPILGYGLKGLVAWTLTFWLVLGTAIHATSRLKSFRTLARALGGIALGAGVFGLVYQVIYGVASAIVPTVVHFVTLIFLIFATLSVLYEVVTTKRVDVDHLIGASASYVLLGLTFTYAFMTLHDITGDSLLVAESAVVGVEPTDSKLHEFLYFSFVSLTTLGFGDLTPVSLSARVLTTMEAISGQLFLTILVARLVGLHISHSQNGKS